MQASVRLRWVLARAYVMQEELLEARGSLQIFFCLRSRRGRNTCRCGTLFMPATRSGEAKNGQYSLQGTSRTALKQCESSRECHNMFSGETAMVYSASRSVLAYLGIRPSFHIVRYPCNPGLVELPRAAIATRRQNDGVVPGRHLPCNGRSQRRSLKSKNHRSSALSLLGGRKILRSELYRSWCG